MELKVDDSAGEAVEQIKQKNYAARFRGKLAEETGYTGEEFWRWGLRMTGRRKSIRVR